MKIFSRFAAIALIASLLCGTFQAEARPLTVGSIDDDPADEINLFHPFISYLAAGIAIGDGTRRRLLEALLHHALAPALRRAA